VKAKINFATLALTSLVCLLPMILGAALYGDLPDTVAVHWNINGEADGFAPKYFAVFGIPLGLMLTNIILIVFVRNDPKRDNAAKAMRGIVEWIVPVVSIVVGPIVVFKAMGVNIPVVVIAFALVGVILIVFGNYMPKNKQNYTIGIKLPWTLNDTENWNKTHRMAGYLWIICGIVIIGTTFLPLQNTIRIVLLLTTLAVIIAVPVLYSFLMHLKSQNGRSE